MDSLTNIRASLLLVAFTLTQCATHGTQAPRALAASTARIAAPRMALDPQRDDDGDGRVNAVDQCPNEPEDIDDFADGDGCPEDDNDRDEIADALDTCPNAAEDVDGFEDGDGCPELDNDQDGIADIADHSAEGIDCRNEPETWNGSSDEDGCPDVAPQEIVPFCGPIDPNVYFRRNSAVIRPGAMAEVNFLATLMANNPNLLEVGLVGYAHNTERRALGLARRRAEAVHSSLVRSGVLVDRLTVRWTTTRPPGLYWRVRSEVMHSVRPIIVRTTERIEYQWNGTRYVPVPEGLNVVSTVTEPTAGR